MSVLILNFSDENNMDYQYPKLYLFLFLQI